MGICGVTVHFDMLDPACPSRWLIESPPPTLEELLGFQPYKSGSKRGGGYSRPLYVTKSRFWQYIGGVHIKSVRLEPTTVHPNPVKGVDLPKGANL